MEQCVRKRKRSKGGRRRLRFIAAAAAALLLTLFALFERSLARAFRAAAAASVSESVSASLNRAILEALSEPPQGALLSVTETGEESFLIIADTALINSLSARAAALAQELVAGETGGRVKLPLGTVTGLASLSGLGPELAIRFAPMGAVEGSITSSLRASGINQSLFSVELTLSASVRLLLAGRDEEVKIKTTVPICETVVVGRVPQVYTNVANEEDMLNLIPTDVP